LPESRRDSRHTLLLQTDDGRAYDRIRRKNAPTVGSE
jgi:hypothetical protein